MIVEFAAMGLLIVLVFTTMLGFIDRFLFGLGLVWTEELARFLLVWTSFLAAIVASRRSAHFRVEFLSSRFGSGYARAIALFGIVVFLTAAWFGVQFAWFFRNQYSPALGISMSLVYAAAPVGFLGMAAYLIRDLFNPDSGPDATSSVDAEGMTGDVR